MGNIVVPRPPSVVCRGLDWVGRGQPPGDARGAVRGPGPYGRPLLLANLVRFAARRGASSQLEIETRSSTNGQ